MTQDEIIDMAEQAGMTQDGDMWFSFGKGDMDVEHKHLVAFAKLVEEKATEKANARANASWTLMCEKMVAFEREACAKVCEELPPVGESKQWERATLKDCAAAIRARGEQA
jgi:hypothetical protein